MTEVHRFAHEYLRGFQRKLNGLSLSTQSMSTDDVDYTDYRFESARLDSFINWTVPFMDPKKLAAAGFYYTGKNDEVKCFECGTVLSSWLDGDEPEVEHQRWSERCQFVCNIPCGNVPIGVDPSTIPRAHRGRDVCGLYGVKYKPENNLVAEDTSTPNLNCSRVNPNAEITVFFDANTNTETKVQLGDLMGSQHPEFSSYARRIRSFSSWPKTIPQKEDLAAAGFFYVGAADNTVCYHCGKGLKDWEVTDDPMQEHVKWFPECKFIQRVLAEKQAKKNDD